jgi:hypothetical protein
MAALDLALCPIQLFSVPCVRSLNTATRATCANKGGLGLGKDTILLGEIGTLEVGITGRGGYFLKLEPVDARRGDEGEEGEEEWGQKHGGHGSAQFVATQRHYMADLEYLHLLTQTT